MAVENKIKVIQPIDETGKICRELSVPSHSNADQVWERACFFG